MNYSYLFGGIATLGLGLWITIRQIKVFLRKEQDEMGWDIKLLAGGVCYCDNRPLFVSRFFLTGINAFHR